MMCRKIFIVLIITINAIGQTYPKYGPAKAVTINGYNIDAMEPFISPNDRYLFFNDLNSGGDTKIHYAAKVDDSTFAYVGQLPGTSQPVTPRLDAVPDMDGNNLFYWTSTRQYPLIRDNLHFGRFNGSSVQMKGSGRVHGNFYNLAPGWIIMDHGISLDGNFLFFNNARFEGTNCAGPCDTHLGIAVKINDSTFAVLPNSETILQNVNDSSYKYYAPFITKDNLELYYTRFRKGALNPSSMAEMCVAVRTSDTGAFSRPSVLFSDTIVTSMSEAPTLTVDKRILYYHKKINGVYKIRMRYRETINNSRTQSPSKKIFNIYPYSHGVGIHYFISNRTSVRISVYNLSGGWSRDILNRHDHSQGKYSLLWDKKNSDGNFVSPGAYVFWFTTGRKKYSKTVVLNE